MRARRLTDTMLSRAHKAQQAGASLLEVAAMLGVNRQLARTSMAAWRKRHGVPVVRFNYKDMHKTLARYLSK